MLAQRGVTCLRLMLEYCQGENRYVEKPAGSFPPNLVRLWDDIFALCEKYGLRILLTPYDTFWMWRRWDFHPYNVANGGPCNKRSRWLLCPETRKLIKNRLAFATERWGGSGALFAWDIWNEIHPAHAENSFEPLAEFVEDVSSFLRETELRLHGRSHPQTVSIFGPSLEKGPLVAECAFRHPRLDFASTHFYETNTIDNPKNTIDAAISTGRLTREAIVYTGNKRPFFDSEHGPIHAFKDKHRILTEPFDDEYFRHIQWAHVASGGAGGGMRWPNRHPHSLTNGMRLAQQGLARFLPLINWKHFQRNNLNREIKCSDDTIVVFGSGDLTQALAWFLRTGTLNKKGMVNQEAEPINATALIPGLLPGHYKVTSWNTRTGTPQKVFEAAHDHSGDFHLSIDNLVSDMAFAITAIGL
jgi:mannan endo-1,4-beta-mannosidase